MVFWGFLGYPGLALKGLAPPKSLHRLYSERADHLLQSLMEGFCGFSPNSFPAIGVLAVLVRGLVVVRYPTPVRPSVGAHLLLFT